MGNLDIFVVNITHPSLDFIQLNFIWPTFKLKMFGSLRNESKKVQSFKVLL